MTPYSLKSKFEISFPLDAHVRASIAMDIETYYNNCPETTYLEAITLWATENEIEFNDINKCLADALKQKLHNEAVTMRMVKREFIPKTFTLDSIM